MRDSIWLVRRPRTGRVRIQLVCLPYAGGSASIYGAWHKRVPSDVEIVAVEPPGRGRRFADPPLSSLEQMVDHLAPALTDALDCPYALFGHSLGALLAYELALVMTARYERPPIMLIPSASRGPTVPLGHPPLHALPRADFVAELRRLGGTPAEVMANEDALCLYEPALRADFRIAETYLRADPIPMDRPMLVLGAVDDEQVSLPELEAWSQVTGKLVDVRHFVGGHFFLHDAGNRVPESIAVAMQRELGHENSAEFPEIT